MNVEADHPPPRQRMGTEALALALIVAVGLVVRLVAMRPSVLHVDEALFASLAVAAGQGDVLLNDVGFQLDRPPLFFWTVGLLVWILGESAVVIRIPNLLFSVLLIAATYIVARRLGGPIAGYLAATLTALSPFAILFGPTVFEEPGAVGLGVAALALASTRHARAGGAVLSLAVAMKLFAVVFLPLALALIILHPGKQARAVCQFAVTFGIGVALLIAFMLFRTFVLGAPWFLTLQYEHVGGTRLLAPDEWGPRATQWLYWTGFFVVGPAILILAAGLLLATIQSVVRHEPSAVILIAFAAGYFGMLSVMQSPIYDRYTFYLLPPVFIACGIGWAWLIDELLAQPRQALGGVVAIVVSFVVLSPAAVAAMGTGYPVAGAGQRTFDGYQQLCDWLAAHDQEGDAIWNQSLSWHLAYCFADSKSQVIWYPNADAIGPSGVDTYLAQSALDDPDVIASLRLDGWRVILEEEFLASDGEGNLRIYRLFPPASPT